MDMKNPFKLVGSWVGAAIGLVGSYFSFAIILHLAEIGKFNFFALFIPFFPIVVGFLIGWGVHVLLEKI